MTNRINKHAIEARLDFAMVDDNNQAAFPTILNAVERYGPDALGSLYRQIGRTPELSKHFASAQAMNHARDKQLDHWRQMFSGKLDPAYFDRAEKIGTIHAQIGLEPTWYVGGYALVLGS